MDYAETFASAAEGEQLSLKSSKCTGHNVPSGFSKSSNDKPSKKVKNKSFSQNLKFTLKTH